MLEVEGGYDLDPLCSVMGLAWSQVAASTLTGKVIRMVDEDALAALTRGNAQHKIRLGDSVGTELA